MKYNLREVSQVKRELDVEVPADDWRAAVQNATRDLSRKVRLPGFRPGKVPSEVVRKMFGKEIETDVLEKIIPQMYEDALGQAKLEPLGRPVLQDKQLPDESGRPLTFTVSFEVKPLLSIDGYQELELKEKAVSVTDADVAKALEEMRARAGRFATVEGRPAADGDYAVVDLTPERGASQRSVLVAIKGGEDAKELDRALVGLVADDETKVRMRRPHVGGPESATSEDHEHGHEHEDDVLYTVRVREIKARELPDLDDGFAREVGPYETLQELKDKLRADLHREKEREARSALVRQALDLLLSRHQVIAPEALVREEVERMLKELAADFKRRGIPIDKLHLDWDRMGETFRPDAEKNVLLELVFDAIADKERIPVPADKVKERIAEMAQAHHRAPEAMRAQLEKEGKIAVLEGSMRREASIDFVLGTARVTREE